MTASIQAKANGTQGALLVNGAEVVTFDSTGIVSGVNKSAVSQMPTLGTAVNTTSGTAIDFTGIPSWVKRITLSLNGVSTSGTSAVRFRIGPVAGVESTGYLGSSGTTLSASAAAINFTAGFDLADGGASTTVRHGSIVLALVDTSTNTWAINGVIGQSDTSRAIVIGGVKPLVGSLSVVRLTTVNGTDTFDAGSVNILYE